MWAEAPYPSYIIIYVIGEGRMCQKTAGQRLGFCPVPVPRRKGAQSGFTDRW